MTRDFRPPGGLGLIAAALYEGFADGADPRTDLNRSDHGANGDTFVWWHDGGLDNGFPRAGTLLCAGRTEIEAGEGLIELSGFSRRLRLAARNADLQEPARIVSNN